jgi:hypothetical protein
MVWILPVYGGLVNCVFGVFVVAICGDELVKWPGLKLVATRIPLDVHYLGLELSGFR